MEVVSAAVTRRTACWRVDRLRLFESTDWIELTDVRYWNIITWETNFMPWELTTNMSSFHLIIYAVESILYERWVLLILMLILILNWFIFWKWNLWRIMCCREHWISTGLEFSCILVFLGGTVEDVTKTRVPTTLQNSFSLTFPDKINNFPWLISLFATPVKQY